MHKKKPPWGFPTVSLKKFLKTQPDVRIHQEWSVSEGDVCEKLLVSDDILVTFVISIYFPCFLTSASF